MDDILGRLASVHRATAGRTLAAGDARTVVLRRTYPAPIDDVWEAITDPERIARWFLPVSGDLRPGGTYQLEGNAGGEIRHCEPPRRLVVTWIFVTDPTPADINEVEVRLTPDDAGGTVFELNHAAVVGKDRWDEFGPGAVGVGWDLTFYGLGLHLETGGGRPDDLMAWLTSPEGRAYVTGSSDAWGDASVAAGTTPDAAAAAVRNTTAFYLPA